MAKEQKTRIYKVNTPDGGIALVDAPTARGAINHIVGNFFKAELATQHELVAAVQQGVEIQTAGAGGDEQGQLPGTDGEQQPQG